MKNLLLLNLIELGTDFEYFQDATSHVVVASENNIFFLIKATLFNEDIDDEVNSANTSTIPFS